MRQQRVTIGKTEGEILQTAPDSTEFRLLVDAFYADRTSQLPRALPGDFRGGAGCPKESEEVAKRQKMVRLTG